jgi:hypothetical protein
MTLNNQPVTVDNTLRVSSSKSRRRDLPVVFVNPPDIELRIKARRAALIDRIVELRTDLRPEALETRRKLRVQLAKLASILRDAAAVSANVNRDLESWLAEDVEAATT